MDRANGARDSALTRKVFEETKIEQMAVFFAIEMQIDTVFLECVHPLQFSMESLLMILISTFKRDISPKSMNASFGSLQSVLKGDGRKKSTRERR